MPEILIVSLVVWDQSNTRTGKEIEAPLTLDLTRYVSPENYSDEEHWYELFMVLSSTGQTIKDSNCSVTVL